MLINSSLFVSFLSAGAAWATQSPLGAAGNGAANCLALSGGYPHAIFDACCSSGSKSGRGSVDGVEFTYSCEQWAAPYKNTAVSAASARECAQLCAASADCPATSWTSKGQCYFITTASYTARPLKSILLLKKTGKLVSELEPEGDCGKAVEAVKALCEKDAAARCEAGKAALVENAKADCAKQGALIQAQCDAKRANCETEMDDWCQAKTATAVQEKISQCEQEKAALGGSCEEVQKRTEAQCQKEKDGLVESGKVQCEAQKSALSVTFEAEKQNLQKALDEANQKLKELGSSAGADTSVSPTSPENEALIQEISRENFSSICLRFGGKTFITTDSQGYKHEWILHCHTNVAGASTPNYNFSCHTQDIIKLLKEQQENPSFRALWVNTNNVCTPWIGGTVTNGGAFLNHHLVLPTRQPWK
ncbi:hypothetical protein BBP40_005605 [Aspergillus hancockii]|nr:hypothetical protein BBP40_005605 [Aspergillus hancockii]